MRRISTVILGMSLPLSLWAQSIPSSQPTTYPTTQNTLPASIPQSLPTSLASSQPTSIPASLPASTPASFPSSAKNVLPTSKEVIPPQKSLPAELTEFTLLDPKGDDNGPGTYTYPLDSSYEKGSFDITSFSMKRDENDLIFSIEFASRVLDPWNSKDWNGHGFSLQLLQIYLDQDNLPSSGIEETLPGVGAKFARESFWEKVILITTQPPDKVKSEVDARAPELSEFIVIPEEIIVRGRMIQARVSIETLGIPRENWGVQILSASTEGYPEENDLFVRRVNAGAGEHRFGGGSDDISDPNFLDMLTPPAKGILEETELQHQILSVWEENIVRLPMIYPSNPERLVDLSNEPSSQSVPLAKKLGSSLTIQSEIFTKWLYQNDQSQGTVSLGNPNVEGDNFSGNNGIGSELALTIIGKVSPEVEAGARVASRFGQQWADFYENGDLAVDENGVPSGVDSTGESLGQNHAAYIQLRGIYIRVAPPIDYIDNILVGSSDLGMFNPWTIGKIRFIDRFNTKGVFVQGNLGENTDWVLARIALPKLFASAGFNTGIDDPLIDNPFFTRDAAYASKVRYRTSDRAWVEWIGSFLLDEEADVNDPDALGSTNVIDEKDGVVSTVPRYLNANTTVEFQADPNDIVSLNLLGGFSYSSPWLCSEKEARLAQGQDCKDLVFNSVEGAQGFSPIAMKSLPGYALKGRLELLDPFRIGLDLKAEYFNISEGWTATFGARREQDVLLTEGFLDGQLPTLNIANEFQDFHEKYYESIIGWHGGTLIGLFPLGKKTKAQLEYTLITYNTNDQNRDTDTIFPDFLFTQGYTDTELFTFANTNDRGRDPRSVYQKFQSRLSQIGALRIDHTFSTQRPLKGYLRAKLIWDSDTRCRNLDGVSCPDPGTDDYLGLINTIETGVSYAANDQLTLGLGIKGDYWIENGRSGELSSTGVADFDDYITQKAKLFGDISYAFGGMIFRYHLEALYKDVRVSDPSRSFRFQGIIRSVATIFVAF